MITALAFLLGAAVGFGAGLYVAGRSTFHGIRTELHHNLEAARLLLAEVPSKSAAPTTTPDDAPPFVPYQGLRDAELARWTDDGGAPEPQPDPTPATRPAAVVLVEQWAADVETTGPIPAVQEPVLIPGEEWRARFNFREVEA